LFCFDGICISLVHLSVDTVYVRMCTARLTQNAVFRRVIYSLYRLNYRSCYMELNKTRKLFLIVEVVM